MSRAQDALGKGFEVLKSFAGDPFTFRSATVLGIVDRKPDFPDDPEFRLKFANRGWSVIELRAADITGGEPKAGEILTEPDGRRHRIEKVFPRQDTVVLHCTVTNTSPS